VWRYQPDWIAPSNYEYSSGFAAATQLLQVRPRLTAIVGSNDLLALGRVGCLCPAWRARAARPMSVVGFDDMPMAALAKPPLTTIRNPIHDIGYAAADALLQQIETGAPCRATA
jgi:DNA-binding LacI/PurR family transcriptional regulator